MTTPALLGLYRPGTTALHRLGVGPKLAALAALGIAVAVLRGPWSALAGFLVVLGLASWARLGVRAVARALRPLLVLVVVLGGYQAWRQGWPAAVEVVTDLLTLVLAATIVTATTPTDAMLDAVTRACRPLSRVGVDPARVALSMALMLRAVPGLMQIARETRDAARARGLERSPRAILVPMALRTVGRAQATGEALAARGVADD